MRIILVDDEWLALRRLSQALADVPDVTVVGTAGDGDAAREKIERLAPDLVFLDVEMPGLSGIEVARSFSKTNAPEIVFCSAFDHYAADAFSVEAIDYLLKPVRPERLRQTIYRARRRQLEKQAMCDVISVATQAGQSALPANADWPETMQLLSLHLPDRHGGRNLRQSDIVWIEAAKDYVLIHTRTRSHILRITMSELAAQLSPSILRVHRSAFVALESIRRRVSAGKGIFTLRLDDDLEIPVGPSYVQQVRAALRQLRPDLD